MAPAWSAPQLPCRTNTPPDRAASPPPPGAAPGAAIPAAPNAPGCGPDGAAEASAAAQPALLFCSLLSVALIALARSKPKRSDPATLNRAVGATSIRRRDQPGSRAIAPSG